LQAAVDGGPVEGLLGAVGGDGGGEGLAITLGADVVERVGGVGAGGEELGVLGDQALAAADAAGGDGLADGDADPLPQERVGDRAGDDGLADLGVGGGDEESGDAEGSEHRESD